MENIWKTYGKHMGNIWKTYGNHGKHMEKSWETYGKHMEHIWEVRRKWSSEWENQRSVHCGDVGFFMEHRG